MNRVLLLIIFAPNLLLAQNTKDIEGIWLNEPGDAKIEITSKEDAYFGKIVWLQNPKDEQGHWKLDEANPNKSLRSRKKLGLEILSNLRWHQAEKEWSDGEIYDPREGDTYSLKASLTNNNTLNLRGYIGFSLFGKTTTWTRE